MQETISSYTQKGIMTYDPETGEFRLQASVINPDIVDIRMVFVEGGVFNSKGDKRVVDIVAGSNKTFTVESFWHSTTCITNKQFMVYVRAQGLDFDFPDNDYPVTNISWIDAARFCNWLCRAHGLEDSYDIGTEEASILDSNGFKIPTVEQWIWVAQGGTAEYDTIFPGSDDPTEVGWFEENSNGSLQPVAQLKPVFIGGNPASAIYDLVGNVWKMTSSPVKD